MFWSKQTPLAWKNLTADWRKLVLISGGVSFAVILMFMQIGFRNALFDNTVQLAKMLNADLFLVSRARYNLPSEQRMPRAFLELARGLRGVKGVMPVYLERSIAEIHVVGEMSQSIRVVGVPLDGELFVDSENNHKRELLRDHRSALLDQRTKKVYHFETRDVDKLRNQSVELSKKEIALVDYIEVGTDFVHDGTIFISAEAIAHYFPMRNRGGPPLDVVDFGLIQVSDQKEIPSIQAALMELGNDNVDVFTKEEIIRREIRFWATSTPIGIIFTIGTLMGLAVGTIICYQILFTDITDHLAEFATLKAMGYGSNYFLLLVLQQSLYLTVFGFIPGLIVTYGLNQILTNTTGLVMLLTPGRVGLVFALTLGMCLFSGLLAVRKLISADPASLFK